LQSDLIDEILLECLFSLRHMFVYRP
jgi:hypothetical protein